MIAGVIDEDHDFESVLADLTVKVLGDESLHIDLGGVVRINEAGAAGWNDFAEVISDRPLELVLVNCSPAVIAQLNRGRLHSTELSIESVILPYFCPECDQARMIGCRTEQLGKSPLSPPVRRCDECDLVLQFDDDPKSYFKSLSGRPGSHTIRTQTVDNKPPHWASRLLGDTAKLARYRGIPSLVFLVTALLVLGGVVAYAAGLFS